MPGFPQGQYIDPSFLAELQAQRRGLGDLLRDTSRERHRTRQDTQTQIGDIQSQKRRGLRDIKTERRRGVQDIGFQRSDVKLGEARGTEDFTTRLTNLISDFQTLGHQQAQAGNAAGLAGGSFLQASSAARQANLARERQPIDVGQARLHEDTATALGRLGVQQHRLLQDTGRESRYLRHDTRHDIGLARQSQHRSLQDILSERQRGRREFIFSQRDLARQARFGGRNLRQSLNAYTQGGN